MESISDLFHDSKKIKRAILSQLKIKKFKGEKIYGNGNAGKKIAEILSKAKVNIQKKLNY